MSSRMTPLQNLQKLLTELNDAITGDYAVVEEYTDALALSARDKAQIDWCLVHYKTALVEVHKTIKNFEDRLRVINANKKIQE